MCVTPDRALTADEVMRMWLGLDGDYAVKGLPPVTKKGAVEGVGKV